MATRTNMPSLCNSTLILVILLCARIGCEWVEISQNYYRKESPRQETVNFNHEETTEAIIVYTNISLLDTHWKKGVIDRVPSVTNIRRVHVPNVKTSSKQIEKNVFTTRASVQMNAPDESYDFTVIAKPNILSKYHEVKIPTDQTDGDKIELPYHINRGNTFERNSESIFFHKPHTESSNILSRIKSVNKGYITNVKKKNLHPGIESVTSIYLSSENKVISTTEWTPQIKHKDESKVNFNYKGQMKVINEQFLPKTVSVINRTEIGSEDKTSEADTTHFKNQIVTEGNQESIKYESNEEATIINSEAISNNTKGSTMNSIWNIIKVVTDTIYKSTRKSFKSKINYLEGLKSNILSSIVFKTEDQVERTWPEDDARSYRRTRATAARGHVEFPSSESALMSISFLTFAVFLIKLVLRLHSSTFKVHLANIRGLHSNLLPVHHHLETEQPHLLFLTETQIQCPLSAAHLDYTGYSLEHNFRSRAGVCVYARNDFCIQRLRHLEDPTFSSLWLSVDTGNEKILYCCVYRSQSGDQETTRLFEYLGEAADMALHQYPSAQLVFLGDFNACHQDWLFPYQKTILVKSNYDNASSENLIAGQVIHTYKNKTMMVTPALVTAVGRAAAAIKSN